MLESYKAVVGSQLEAVLCTLDRCIDRCPESAWDAPVGNLAFCQVVFHTLFYTDCLLGPDVDAMKRQAFHHQHADFFGDYEELEDRAQVRLYDRGTIRVYLLFCRDKAAGVIAAETPASLAAPVAFSWLTSNRAELYVYLIRHIQHHAAQLSLRLRLDHQAGIPWVKTGWLSQ